MRYILTLMGLNHVSICYESGSENGLEILGIKKNKQEWVGKPQGQLIFDYQQKRLKFIKNYIKEEPMVKWISVVAIVVATVIIQICHNQ